uniref:Ig-like domain-containing protein n=1 Tax=Astyanax mexicanus TaxID=7994 RepID=W5KFQ7_ASTMX
MSLLTMWISGAVVLLLSGCAAAQITYAKDWEVARSGRTPIIKCTVDSSTSLSSTTLHLYKQKPEGDMRRIMHFPAGSQSATLDKETPRRFNAVIREQTVSLTISRVQPEDAAVYYCALWKGDKKVFGSGTRLFVTGEKTEPPKLSAFPVSRSGDGRSVLLCQARGMYPDLVKFMWKDQAGNEVKLSDTEELLEQRDEGQEVRVTSMLIIDQQKARSNTFTCSVQHDRSANNDLKSVVIPAGNSEDETKPEINPNPVPIPTCPPPKEEEEEKEEEKEVENYGISK